MRKFWVLLCVSFKGMLHTFSFGRGKKRAASGAAALIFISAMALYLSGIYSFMLADTLRTINLLEFLLPLMALIACAAALMFTLFGANSVVFGNRDSDLLLSLPVSSFVVMLSKILALYLENLLFCGLWMVPTCIAYILYADALSVGFLIRALICIPFLPLLPSMIGVLLGYCVAFFSAHAKHKALISNLLYFVLFGTLMIGSMQLNRLSALLLTNSAAVQSAFSSWLLPFGLLQRGIAAGSWGAVIGFCIGCAIPFFIIVYALSTQYKRILSTLASRSVRNDYKVTRLQSQGAFMALFRKEIHRYFGTPIYFFNTAFGILILLGGSIYLCFSRTTVMQFLAMTNMTGAVAPLVCAALCFCVATVNTTCVSISLEGNALWILREAPVSSATLLAVKGLLNVVVAWPISMLALLITALALSMPVGTALSIALLCTVLILFIAQYGLIINLLLPKMDAENDTLVVKQSAGSFCGIFGGMILAGLCVFLYFMLNTALAFILFILILAAVLAVLCLGEWYWLTHQGVARFERL